MSEIQEPINGHPVMDDTSDDARLPEDAITMRRWAADTFARLPKGQVAGLEAGPIRVVMHQTEDMGVVFDVEAVKDEGTMFARHYAAAIGLLLAVHDIEAAFEAEMEREGEGGGEEVQW